MRTEPVTARGPWALASAAALALLLAGCGGSDDAAVAPAATPTPSAAPTPTVLSGTWSGTFADVADAPKGTGKVAGKATLVISAKKTVASIAATGLDPKAVYVAHVHAMSCADSEGGGHFQFTPGGAAAPPNEVWLTPVTVTSAGKGAATTTAKKPVTSDAKSVVIHLKRAAGAKTDEAKPPKVACADLAPKKA